ncbi:MAG: aspartyl/glutamyl-tRNA amidotransferase subunit C [Candidatus Pacebacteria bacterium]|nr:aspartyl/glutamyl-tRNA amidotransferase subunit C [Candidatus Paceibacterota bacterium]
MKREDIEHLSTLSRIRLTEKEIETLPKELSTIMEYVSVVSGIADNKELDKPQVGARFNIFRKDSITNKPNEFSEDIISEMPESEGRFMSVKKILQTDE